MQRPDLRDIHQLTKDEFKRILGPVAGSLDDGSKVVLGMQSDVFACCSIQGDQISVRGTPRFEQAIKSAYAQAKPTMWFGSAEKERPKTETIPPALKPKTDTTSATTYRVPVLIYKSKREPGKNVDGSPAEDMTYGTMTAEQIKAIPMFVGKMGDDGFIGDLEKSDPKVFFSSFRNMTTLFATGDLKMNILAMIAKFEKSEGGEYRNQALTRAARAHPTTIKFSDTLIKEVKAKLAEVDGDVNKLVLSDLMQQYSKTSGFRLPIFNSAVDKVQGLTIAVNDVWAGKAEITTYEKFGDFYKGTIKVTLYDHFGLDYPDIGPDPTTGRVKFYGLASGFRSWFVLQHYKRFAYKPFLTVIELSYPFQGELK